MGWIVVFLSTLMINHFDLFGLRQTFGHAMGKRYEALGFRVNGFYKFVRHPIMVGFMIAFWAAPTMSMGHLIFAIATTAYMFVGMLLEEKDTAVLLGDDYKRYRREVSMIMPMPPKKSAAS